MLADARSIVEHLDLETLETYDQAVALSTALLEASKIKSLTMGRLTCNPADRAAVFGGIRGCTSLRKVQFAVGGGIDVSLWEGGLVSLIECDHIQRISYHERIDAAEISGVPADQIRALRNARTQRIINAIDANTNLIKLDLWHGDNLKCIDPGRIYAVINTRNEQLSAQRMSRLLQAGGSQGLQLFGAMICRLGTDGRARSTNILFDLLQETSDNVVGLFEQSRTSMLATDPSEKKHRVDASS